MCTQQSRDSQRLGGKAIQLWDSVHWWGKPYNTGCELTSYCVYNTYTVYTYKETIPTGEYVLEKIIPQG